MGHCGNYSEAFWNSLFLFPFSWKTKNLLAELFLKLFLSFFLQKITYFMAASPFSAVFHLCIPHKDRIITAFVS